VFPVPATLPNWYSARVVAFHYLPFCL